jgi:organic radical activating enzyme
MRESEFAIAEDIMTVGAAATTADRSPTFATQSSVVMASANRYARLALQGGRYLTARKIANLLLCESEKWRRSARVRSYPYVATLDVTNSCNLRCPFCPTGAKRDAGRHERMMPLSAIDDILYEIGSYLISVNLFNWGEPFVNPQIGEIVERIHARRIFTQISSNLSVSRQSAILDTVRGGLDYLMVSTSGATQNTYSKYHRRGRLAALLDNIRAVTELKKKLRIRAPVVELKYLMFRHNAHEVEAAREQAKKLGVDVFRVVRGGGEAEWLVDSSESAPSMIPTKLCNQLWHTVVINSDATVSPCCYLYFKSDDFGDLSQSTVREARNSPRYVTARKLFDPSLVDKLPPDLEHPCLKCELVHRVPHLQTYLASNPHARVQARTGGP